MALFGVVVILIGIYLARVPAYNAEDFIALQKSSFAPFLKDLAFRWHAGQVMLDLVLITVCYYVAYRLRFEGEASTTSCRTSWRRCRSCSGCKLAALYVSGLYQRSWETFGLRDLTAWSRGVGVGLAARPWPRPITSTAAKASSRVVFVLDALLLAVAIIATRVSFRTMNLVAATRNKRSRRVLVYGAGALRPAAGARDARQPAWHMNPVAFIDDDPRRRSAGSSACRCAARSTGSRRRCAVRRGRGHPEQPVRSTAASKPGFARSARASSGRCGGCRWRSSNSKCEMQNANSSRII